MFPHTTRVWHGAFFFAVLDTDKLKERERSRDEGGIEGGRESRLHYDSTAVLFKIIYFMAPRSFSS